MGMKGGVKKILECHVTQEDITNNKQMQAITKIKLDKQQAKTADKTATSVKKDIKKIENKGLMAKPENKQEVE